MRDTDTIKDVIPDAIIVKQSILARWLVMLETHKKLYKTIVKSGSNVDTHLLYDLQTELYEILLLLQEQILFLDKEESTKLNEYRDLFTQNQPIEYKILITILDFLNIELHRLGVTRIDSKDKENLEMLKSFTLHK